MNIYNREFPRAGLTSAPVFDRMPVLAELRPGERSYALSLLQHSACRAFNFRICGLLLELAILMSPLANAAGVVSRCDDASLNAALRGGGVVTFTCTGTLLVLTNPTVINADTWLVGNGHVTLDGGNAAQLFVVSPGVKLTVENLSFVRGKAIDTPDFRELGGGAIDNQGTLVVRNCRFWQNFALWGGAIYNEESGTLDVSGSTFFGNSADFHGGAISNAGQASITNSTFYGNFADLAYPNGDGGAISNGSKMTLTNCTITYNGAPTHDDSHPGAGGGNIASYHQVILQNTIIANPINGGNCWTLSDRPLTNIVDGGGNLRWPGPDLDPRCPGLGSVGDPQLIVPLHNNGGPTETLALAKTSPAIDTAVDGFCPPTDQRGVIRPQGAHCDIGAYEYATPFSLLTSVYRQLLLVPIQSYSGSVAKVQNGLIDPLSRSLNPAFWHGTDGNRLDPTHGSEVFAIQQHVVNGLSNFIVGPTRLVYIQNLLLAGRVLAETAIADAQCQSNSDLSPTPAQRSCGRANSELVAGDTSGDAGDFGQSIEHYANAWRAVVSQ